jgi:hypothetical protein
MSIRACFQGKVTAGKVSADAGNRILTTLDEVMRERHATHAAQVTAAMARGEATRQADLYYGQTIAQANVLRTFYNYNQAIAGLRAEKGVLGFGNKAPPTLGKDTQTTIGFALRSLLARDPWEIATGPNVAAAARQLRGAAHASFAEGIEFLRAKMVGFKAERVRELDMLRSAYGEPVEDVGSTAVWKAWSSTNERMVDDFNGAGGALHKRPDYIPNPSFAPAKVKALGEQNFKALVRDNVDRAKIIDFRTDQPMTDGRFERLLDDAWRSIVGWGDGIPTSAPGRGAMLANARAAPRLFQWKDSEAWLRIAQTMGDHDSPFQAMTGHIESLTNDTAMMRVLGPNPEATKRFAVDLMSREAARLAVPAADPTSAASLKTAALQNAAIEGRVSLERRLFENLYAEVSGENRIPVGTTLAQYSADVRHWMSATQMGSAIISSFTDPVTLAMVTRFNGLPVANVLRRAVSMMAERGSEIFAAQQGLVADSLAHIAGATNRIVGDEASSGLAAKLSSANIRLSGLRRWSQSLRGAFALEMMAHGAHERGKAFGELDLNFREALARYGIGPADWDRMRAVDLFEPRTNAPFLRAAELAEAGHADLAERWSRLINTEMDYAVIDNDPLTRSMLVGSSQPGTLGGEFRRHVTMYKSFPTTFITMHFARALARGWDGRRLSHAALTFGLMTAVGALAMEAKEIAKGRDPLTLDPTEANGLRAWGAAMLQGGGLGTFGDMLTVDQTKYGNSWAAHLAGPLAGSVETVLGDFIVKNIQLAGKGKETHFLGDALYAGARFVPGSSLWFGRLAFQREVLDQLALMADPRTRERFSRMEQKAREDWGQSFWWQPGRTQPTRPPALEAVRGRE